MSKNATDEKYSGWRLECVPGKVDTFVQGGCRIRKPTDCRVRTDEKYIY